MPQAAVKLIWSMAACNFCPRSDVRTCQIKPGKLLSKLSSALELDESLLDHSEGICTCCLADIDMIIRSVAIRGAMKDYFLDMLQNVQRGYFNGHQRKPLLSPTEERVDDAINFSMGVQQEGETRTAPPPPTLVARPPFPNDCPISEQPEIPPEVLPSSPIPTPPTTTSKKPKERLTRYQCILCDKIAGSKSHCMEHLICHSPVRPFTCSQCMKTYKSRKACREHLIVMHGVEKIEDNLQRLVLVDHEGLKQLEHVCTQYRRIYNQGPPKAPSSSSTVVQSSFKSEPALESDGGSAWLFKPPPGTPSRLPPPLLQCLPATSSPTDATTVESDNKPLCNETEPTPPPKRTRKGTPHKLVHDSQQSEPSPETFEHGNLEDSFDDDSRDVPKKPDVPEKLTDDDELSFQAPDPLYLDNVNQPFFPSFQQCKIEPSFPTVNRHSPTGMPRKALPPCTICGRYFPTKEKMADHMRSHSEIKQFSCLVCNRFFKYRRGVTNHLKEVHHMTDRVEISSKVASHEVGCIIPKSSKLERKNSSKSGKKTEKEELAESSISERVIQDTLSSLAEIQQATDNAAIPLQISSDESVSMTDADDSAFIADDHSSPGDLVSRSNRVTTSNESPLPDCAMDFGSAAVDTSSHSSERNHWPSTGADFTDFNYLPSISSGATTTTVPDLTTAVLDSITCASKPLVE